MINLRRNSLASAIAVLATLAACASAQAAYPGSSGPIVFDGSFPRSPAGPNNHPVDDLYLINGDGTGATRLTHSAADESGPWVSPDGTRVACRATSAASATSSPRRSPGQTKAR